MAYSNMATKTKFSWKRKQSEKISKEQPSTFTNETNEESEPFVEDWRALSKKIKLDVLEDRQGKSDRLRNEGVALAQLQRYWESITKWNEAIQFTPGNEILFEMKAQVLLELNEIYPAIQAAEMAVSLNSRCTEALQTLGRAQLGLGEIDMAIKSFSKALHIKPDSAEIWNEDLCWAKELRNREINRNQINKPTTRAEKLRPEI